MEPLSRDIMAKTDMEISVYGNICFSCIMFSINSFVYNVHMPGSKLYCN